MKNMKSLLYGLIGRPLFATPSLAALVILLAGSTGGQAADGTWTLNGTGAWSDIANWNSGVGPVATGTGFTATFASGGTTTVRLDSSRTIGNLTFSTAGTYLLDNNGSGSNILTLDAATPTISVAASTTATISAEIAGTAGLTKANSGGSASILVLSGANTYSGTTTISGGSAGFIQINANSGLGTSDVLLNAANGGLRFGGAFSYSHSTVLGSSGGRFDTNGNNVTISSDLSGTISGGSSLTKVGTGTLTLAGNNTIGGAGGVNVSAGALSIDSNARLGSGSGPLTLNGGAITYGAAFNDLRAITLGNSDGTLDTNGFNVGYSQTITGIAGQDLKKAGLGTLTLTGTQSYLGTTIVNAGTLLVNGSHTAGALTVNTSATLGGNGTITAATTVAAGGTLAPGSTLGTLTFANGLNLSTGTSKATFEAGDSVAVTGGTLSLASAWDLTISGLGYQDGGSVTLFTYTAAGTIFTNADITLIGLGFTPGGSLSLTNTGSSIVLNGISVIPEPSTVALVLAGGMLTIGLIRRRARKAARNSIGA